MDSGSNGKLSQAATRPNNASSHAAERREIESATLLAGGRELLIRHGSEIYTLRRTSKGKLILTK